MILVKRDKPKHRGLKVPSLQEHAINWDNDFLPDQPDLEKTDRLYVGEAIAISAMEPLKLALKEINAVDTWSYNCGTSTTEGGATTTVYNDTDRKSD